MYNYLAHDISGNEASSERLVYKYMMEGYNPSVRPVRDDSDTVDLKVDIYLHLLQDLVRISWLFSDLSKFLSFLQPSA